MRYYNNTCRSRCTLRPDDVTLEPSRRTDSLLILPTEESQQILPHTHTDSCEGMPTGIKSSGDMLARAHMESCIAIMCFSGALDRSSSVVNMYRYLSFTLSKSSSLISTAHLIPKGFFSDGLNSSLRPNSVLNFTRTFPASDLSAQGFERTSDVRESGIVIGEL